MSGYRGGIFKCPFYSRDYREYLNCEGCQLRMQKRVLDGYAKRYCASDSWKECTVARILLKKYESEEREHEKP